MIFLVLNIYLFLAEGQKFINNYNKIGLSGFIGGVSLGIANISFILSITTTTAAVTMMMLATQPFVAAILAYIFLKEKNLKNNINSHNYCSSWNNIYVV